MRVLQRCNTHTTRIIGLLGATDFSLHFSFSRLAKMWPRGAPRGGCNQITPPLLRDYSPFHGGAGGYVLMRIRYHI